MGRLKSAWVCVVLAGAGVAWLLLVAVHAGPPGLAKGPYLQNAGPTAITVQYEMDGPGEGIVRFGAGGAMDQQVAAQLHEKVEFPVNPKDKQSPLRAAYLYRARLTGLRPGTEYQYQVLPMGEKGAAATAKTFRTFPEKADRVTFIAYGDTRSNPKMHRALAARFASHDPAFILHNGDLVSKGDAPDLWGPQFFLPLADVVDHVSLWPALGNHERGAKYLLRYFDLPAGRTWYSFDYGPVHVVVLDDNQEGPDVLKWLDADLAAAKAPWKIAMYHAPSFNFGGHRSDSHRLTFLPLLVKHGVDVVVMGHSHLYERFVPLVPVAPAAGAAGAAGAGAALPAGGSRRPISFVTLGGGGAPLASSPKMSPPAVLAKAAKAYHYGVLTVDNETLRMRVLTPDGEIDSLAIAKKGGRYDDAYLAQARPMEEAIVALGVILTEPAPIVDALPTPAQAGRVTILTRFFGMTAPVTLTVRLADASTEAYAMDPVSVEIQPNQRAQVALTLRALRKVTAERDEKRVALNPEPRFVVTARAAGFQASCETAKVVYRWIEAQKAKAKAAKGEALDPHEQDILGGTGR